MGATFRSLDDKYLMALCLLNLGSVLDSIGDEVTAQRCLEESLGLARECGDAPGVGFGMLSLGRRAYDAGDDATAHDLIARSVGIARDLGDHGLLVNGLIALIGVEVAQEHIEQAWAHTAELLAIAAEQGNLNLRAAALAKEGRLLGIAGQLAAARESLTASLRLDRRLDHPVRMIANLERFAEVAAAAGDGRRAMTLAGAAEAQWLAVGTRPSPRRRARIEAALAPWRTTLGEGVSDGALDSGRQAMLDEAVAYALGELTWEGLRDAVAARAAGGLVGDGE